MSSTSNNSDPTVLNGKLVTVETLDGAKTGIRVRHVRANRLDEYAMAISNEYKLAELYCEQPAGWAETLTDESLIEVLEQGEKMNGFLSKLLAMRMGRIHRASGKEFSALVNTALASPPKPG